MKADIESLRVLLVQARDEVWILQQEQQCFAERAGLDPGQFVSANVLERVPQGAALHGVDAVFIGGSGAYSVAQDYPWMPGLLDFTRRAVESGLPVFGSCWGHQLIARALGGTVVHDPERAELGCFEVELNEAGRADPLFAAFPARFRANQGHHDRVAALPSGVVSLAHSATQPHQALRVDGLPVYGTQFHSELDACRERERLVAYRAHYPESGDDAAFQQVLDGLADTTEVDGLLHHFLLRYALLPR